MCLRIVDLGNLKAKDIMQQDFLTAFPQDRMCELIARMTSCDKEEVIILNPENEQVIGLITRKHLLREFNNGVVPQSAISELIKHPVICVNVDDDIYTIRELMRQKKIGRVPVLNHKGKMVGLVTAVSICNGFSDRMEEVWGYLKAVLDSITEAAMVFNKYYQLIYWNDSAEKLYKHKLVIGASCEGIIKPDPLENVINTGKVMKNIYEVENNKHFVKNIGPITKNGEIIGVVCTVSDVTKIVNLMNKVDRHHYEAKIQNGRHEEGGRGLSLISLEPPCFELFLGKNGKFSNLVALARKAALVDATVLIRGETGTGKEIMARSLHYAGPRRKKPFVVVDCSAIPETLFESELFGYEPGAFTGALKNGKKGKLELAGGGTLFLDEVGELPPEMQAKLLRVIQEREFYKVGGVRPIRVDVRIIAATNRDLQQMVKDGNFREDLYYRLNVITLELPALRHKLEDLPDLIRKYILQFSRKHGIKITKIEEEVMNLLINYNWPGNYRELRNIAERLVLTTEDGCIRMEHLPENIMAGQDVPHHIEEGAVSGENQVYYLEEMLTRKERETIIRTLRLCQNNKAKAARLLHMPRSTLYYKLRSLKIEIPQEVNDN